MSNQDPVVSRELPVIQKIIADETWLEGERRGCPVAPDDPVVRENVCQIVLRIGAALRAAILGPPESAALIPVEPMPPDHLPREA